MNTQQLITFQCYFNSRHTPERCIGSIPQENKCNRHLRPEINFGNSYCWNCVYNYLKNINPEYAAEIAELYL